jgi:hypothetical protein
LSRFPVPGWLTPFPPAGIFASKEPVCRQCQPGAGGVRCSRGNAESEANARRHTDRSAHVDFNGSRFRRGAARGFRRRRRICAAGQRATQYQPSHPPDHERQESPNRPIAASHFVRPRQFLFWRFSGRSTSCSGSMRTSLAARTNENRPEGGQNARREILGSSPGMTPGDNALGGTNPGEN